MVARRNFRTALLGRDVVTAYALIVALYLLKYVPFRPVQLPAYLLIAAYDIVEGTLPVITPYYPVGFPVFLYGLAVGGARLARTLRATERDRAVWLQILGGVSLVIALLAVGFGAVVGGPLVSATDNPTPLAITGLTGGCCVAIAWWLLGRPTRDAINRV